MSPQERKLIDSLPLRYLKMRRDAASYHICAARTIAATDQWAEILDACDKRIATLQRLETLERIDKH